VLKWLNGLNEDAENGDVNVTNQRRPKITGDIWGGSSMRMTELTNVWWKTLMRKATVKASLSRCDCSHKHSNCIEYAQPPSVDVRLILDILYISQVAPLLLLLHPQLDPWSDSDCRGWTWMFSTAGNVVLYSQLHSAVISSIQWCRQSNTQNFENRSAEVADKSIVTLVPCHTCDFVARLWRATKLQRATS